MSLGPDANHPFSGAIAVTPSDSVDIAGNVRAVYVGGAGNLSVIMRGGQTVTFNGVPAGATLNIRATRIRATGTTATNILALL